MSNEETITKLREEITAEAEKANDGEDGYDMDDMIFFLEKYGKKIAALTADAMVGAPKGFDTKEQRAVKMGYNDRVEEEIALAELIKKMK